MRGSTAQNNPKRGSRSPNLFDSVLKYYLTGALHIPAHACRWDFKTELDFWQIPREIVAYCCQRKLPELDEAEFGVEKNLLESKKSEEMLEKSMFSQLRGGEKRWC